MAVSPASAPTTSALIVRPSYIPASIDYEALPEPVRRALVSIVGPAYQDVVETARSAMQRAVGNTLVALLALEVLHQFDVTRGLDFDATAGADASPASDKLARDHLRLVSVKQMASHFLLRLNPMCDDSSIGTVRTMPAM